MIGKQQLIFDAARFVSGMASSDFAPDGGVGTSSFNLNPFLNPGIVKAMASGTDVSTNVAGDIIASCEDSQAVSAQSRTMVDNAGNYYFWNGSSITKKNTGSATTHYLFGKTDMAAFAGQTYVTLDNDIALWNTSGTPSLTESWWVTTKSQSALDSTLPHPLLVFENLLWVADGGNLHSISSGGTITLNVLQLNSNERIQALAIDPATGLMMISVQTATNYSDSLSSKFFVYLYDGYSSKPRRKISVDDLVTAFYPLGGTVYVGYGQRLGAWNGSGISFLRKLAFSLSGSDLLYKHHFSHWGNVLLIVNKTNVLAYGEVVAGKKAFYNIIQEPNATTLKWMAHMGNNKIAIAFTSSNNPTVYTFDPTSTAAGTASLYFNNVYFPRPVYIRGMRVITDGITTTNGLGDLTIITDSATLQPPSTLGQFVVPSSVSPKYTFDFNFTSKPAMAVQPRINFDTQGFSVIRVIVYYDVAE